MFIAPDEIPPVGDGFPKTTVGHTGFMEISTIIEPESELCMILLTNHVYGDGAS